MPRLLPVLAVSLVLWLASLPACGVAMEVDEGTAVADTAAERLGLAYFETLRLPFITPFHALLEDSASPWAEALVPFVWVAGFAGAALLYGFLLSWAVSGLFARRRPEAPHPS